MTNEKSLKLFSEEMERIKFSKEAFIDFWLGHNFSLENHLLSDLKTVSPYYVNLRSSSDNRIIEATVEHLHNFILEKFPEKIDSYVGVPYGMTGIGNVMSMKYGNKIVTAKKEETKNAETFIRKWFNGLEEGDNVLVLEDTIRTADDTYNLCSRLKEAKANVIGAVALVDRKERTFKAPGPGQPNHKERVYSASDILRQDLNVKFFSLTDINYLLKRYDQKISISDEKKKECADYYWEHGSDIIVQRFGTGEMRIVSPFPFLEMSGKAHKAFPDAGWRQL